MPHAEIGPFGPGESLYSEDARDPTRPSQGLAMRRQCSSQAMWYNGSALASKPPMHLPHAALNSVRDTLISFFTGNILPWDGSSVNMPRFGEKLRALRLRQGLTLRELAIVLGYRNFGYLALLESGKKEPTLELVMKVAQYFQVTTDQLVWDHLQLDDDRHSPTLPDTDDTP